MNLGWECPKCHRVWSPAVLQCADCNCADHLRGSAIPYDPFHMPRNGDDPLRVPCGGDPLPTLPSITCGGVTSAAADVFFVA